MLPNILLPNFFTLKFTRSIEIKVTVAKLVIYMVVTFLANVSLNVYALVNLKNVDFRKYLTNVMTDQDIINHLIEASIFIKGDFETITLTDDSTLSDIDNLVIERRNFSTSSLIENDSDEFIESQQEYRERVLMSLRTE